MPIPTITRDRVSRRSVLKTGSLVVGATMLSGCGASATPKPDNHDLHKGGSSDVGDGEVRAYATTNPSGKLSSLGVHVDGDAMDEFGEAEEAAHLHFPTETTDGDALDTHQFTYMGFHYNPAGHPPPGIYDVPHFDFHFYMIEEDVVADISGGPLGESPLPFLGLAGYDVPDDQFPSGYVFEEHRFIVEEMGEHLLDGTAPEFQGEDFTHTYVYGVHDPSIDMGHPGGSETIELAGDEVELPVYEGDGEGMPHFVEPMITTDFIRNDLDEELAVDVVTPEAFPTADDYPTEYVMKPDGDGGVFVSIDDFEEFPSSGG